MDFEALISVTRVLTRIAEALDRSNAITASWMSKQQELRDEDVAVQQNIVALHRLSLQQADAHHNEVVAVQKRSAQLQETLVFGEVPMDVRKLEEM